MAREVKNDKLTTAQLQEAVRQVVKNEIRRQNGVLSNDLGVEPKHRFMCPWRDGTGGIVNYTNATGTPVYFILKAGPKDLHIKRIVLSIGDTLVSATLGTGALALRRAFIPDLNTDLSPDSNTTNRNAVPVCLTTPHRPSSIMLARSTDSGASQTLTSGNGLVNPYAFPSMGSITVFEHRTNAAFPRMPAVLDLRNDDDSDLIVIPKGTALILAMERQAPSSNTGFPSGYLEWEE